MYKKWKFFIYGRYILSGVCTYTQQCHWCVLSALSTHTWCVTYHIHVGTLRAAIALGANATRVPLLCTACICSSFQPFFDQSFHLFLNLHFVCLKDGQQTGLYCLAMRFLNYNFSPLATEWHWGVCVWTKYRTAVSHTAFVKRFWHTEVADMSARVNPALSLNMNRFQDKKGEIFWEIENKRLFQLLKPFQAKNNCSKCCFLKVVHPSNSRNGRQTLACKKLWKIVFAFNIPYPF